MGEHLSRDRAWWEYSPALSSHTRIRGGLAAFLPSALSAWTRIPGRHHVQGGRTQGQAALSSDFHYD